MEAAPKSNELGSKDVADVLTCLARLMETFRESDLALQNALSTLTRETSSSPNMFQLQHIDLLTQTHCDLARMLPILASSLRGEPKSLEDLRSGLTLRSLQDVLIDTTEEQESTVEAGELSLF